MAQLIVRNIEEIVKRRLKKRADAHGRSLEGEVREILRKAVDTTRAPDQTAFGTRFAAYFAGIGVELERPPREPVRAINFE